MIIKRNIVAREMHPNTMDLIVTNDGYNKQIQIYLQEPLLRVFVPELDSNGKWNGKRVSKNVAHFFQYNFVTVHNVSVSVSDMHSRLVNLAKAIQENRSHTVLYGQYSLFHFDNESRLLFGYYNDSDNSSATSNVLAEGDEVERFAECFAYMRGG